MTNRTTGAHSAPDPHAPILPDLLAPGLRLVFVGINPSVYSAERGQYFARPSNRFWPLLNQSGLLPEPLGPADGARLLALGIGLTDVVKRATPSAADLTAVDYAIGRVALEGRLRDAAPQAVCFVGKVAYERYRQVHRSSFGRQPQEVHGAAVFVMPSTSGRCNHLHAQRLATIREVAAYLGQ